ncbi:MAG TPA: magnesium transporter CorA family protein [Methyloceanibacter sp.]|jgi:magnesium transporter|nr:magnesium transporter CorA family protein [Methyloceanibacter sp.]
MLTIYENRAGTLSRQKGKPRIGEEAVWIDLLNPTEDEEKKVERALKFDVPTREEQLEIEASSRLYQENGAYFMTATLLYTTDQGDPRTTPATFILAGQRLVTVRYAEPRAFSIFVARCNRTETDLKSGPAVMIGLLDTIIDRLADFIERLQAEVEGLSHSIFEIKGGAASRQRRFDVLLRAIGREGEITSQARESAHSLGRLLTFLIHAANERKEVKPLQARIRTAARDVTSLTDYATFLSGKIIFLLDATLGMIQIQQNDIIKIFSVAAVVFLPPTLIASIYGMNFHFMPELSWWLGYPLALVLMVVAAVVPYLYFKRRGWL